MAKVTLNDPATLDSSILALITANNTAIENAMEKTLSRDGTSPNSMEADLDMDGNQILNLPEPSANTDVVRKIDLDEAVEELEDLIDTMNGAPVASTVLSVLLTVDGAGSGLDADLLDGLNSTDFALVGHNHTGVYQPLDSDLTSWAGISRASGFDTFAATPSSANLAALLTDETGSGANVHAVTPTLTSSTTGTAPVTLNNSADAAANVGLALVNSRATQAAFDQITLDYYLKDSAGNSDRMGRLAVQSTSNTSTSETARLNVSLVSAGSDAIRFFFNPTSFTPGTNDSASLGLASTSFSDLFLASGGEINWANGAATITSSASTGAIVYAADPGNTIVGSMHSWTVDSNTEMTLNALALAPGSNDGNALGTSSLSWADLFLASGGVINWNNGNVVLTHSSGILNLSTGTLQVGGSAVITTASNPTFTSATNNVPAGNFTNSADSTFMSAAAFRSTTATPAAADQLYTGYFMPDDAATQIEYGRVGARIVSATSSGSVQEGELAFSVRTSGNTNLRVRLGASAMVSHANDLMALGTSSLGWSDLFLASGGEIRVNNVQVLDTVGGLSTQTETAANIAAIGNAINTANKRAGKMVFDTTNNRLMIATGSTAGSTWKSADGATTVTPA